MGKHTPGPWDIDSDGSCFWIRSEDGRLVVKNEFPPFMVTPDGAIFKTALCFPIDRSQEEHEANARLVAAAPELLEWLRAIVDQADAQKKSGDKVLTVGHCMVECIRAAIRKAEGA